MSPTLQLLFSWLREITLSFLSTQVILFLIMLVMRKRVALTIALFHVAGKVFIHLPLLVFQPFWTFFALVLFWAYWIMTLLFLGTTGKKKCSFFLFSMKLSGTRIFKVIRESWGCGPVVECLPMSEDLLIPSTCTHTHTRIQSPER